MKIQLVQVVKALFAEKLKKYGGFFFKQKFMKHNTSRHRTCGFVYPISLTKGTSKPFENSQADAIHLQKFANSKLLIAKSCSYD